MSGLDGSHIENLAAGHQEAILDALGAAYIAGGDTGFDVSAAAREFTFDVADAAVDVIGDLTSGGLDFFGGDLFGGGQFESGDTTAATP